MSYPISETEHYVLQTAPPSSHRIRRGYCNDILFTLVLKTYLNTHSAPEVHCSTLAVFTKKGHVNAVRVVGCPTFLVFILDFPHLRKHPSTCRDQAFDYTNSHWKSPKTLDAWCMAVMHLDIIIVFSCTWYFSIKNQPTDLQQWNSCI